LGKLVVMRHRKLMLAIVLASIGSAASAQSSDAPWLDALMQRMAAIPARQAEFVEEKRLVALNQPLISRGQLIYRRPSYIEKVTTSPQPETLIVNGDQLTIGSGNDGSRVMSLASQPAIAGLVDGIRAALAGDLSGLRRLYRITSDGGPAAWRLILTPDAPPLAHFLRSVIIEGTNTDIHAIEIVETNGDIQRMTIVLSK
jgi:outer membrane lipoprotein-sorting protein